MLRVVYIDQGAGTTPVNPQIMLRAPDEIQFDQMFENKIPKHRDNIENEKQKYTQDIGNNF